MAKVLINLVIYLIILFLINKTTTNTKELTIKKSIILVIMLTTSTLLTLLLTNTYNNFYIISILSNITIITLYKRIIDKYKVSEKINYKNILLYILIGLSISFILETTIFNFRHYESLENERVSLKNPIMKDIVKEGDYYTVKKTKKYIIKYSNINKEINNIKIDYKNILNPTSSYDITIYGTDDTRVEPLNLSTITVTPTIEKSKYHKINLSGKTHNLILELTLNQNELYELDNISINNIIPLQISILRIMTLTTIILLFYLFRPSSLLYKTSLLDSKNKNNIIIIFFLIEATICSSMYLTNTLNISDSYEHQKQYAELAKSFKKGHTYLDIKTPKELSKLSNPYDHSLRQEAGLVENEDYLWDTAYYNNKYYVYFGVLPVISAYLPYNLITGKDLGNHTLIYIVGILTIISSIYLIYQIIKRWFKNTSIGIFIILSLLFINSSGILVIFKNHDLYSIPIIYALFLATLGLGLWISSYNKESKKYSKIRLVLGSLCLALTATCRPQFLIASFFIFPLFLSYFIKEGKITKKKILELACLLVPYIIVAIPLMTYNCVRFDSILDFGANYNLTFHDMTQRDFNLDRIPTGLYYYLFSLPSISPLFPFLEPQLVNTSYIGMTISEEMFGGFITCNIITLFSFLAPKIKKDFQDKNLYYLTILSIIFTFIVVIADTEMGGIFPRYSYDFSWLLLLGTIIVILTLNKKHNNRSFKSLVISLTILSVIYCASFALLEQTQNILEINRPLYESIKYFICFWL